MEMTLELVDHLELESGPRAHRDTLSPKKLTAGRGTATPILSGLHHENRLERAAWIPW